MIKTALHDFGLAVYTFFKIVFCTPYLAIPFIILIACIVISIVKKSR